MTTSRVTRAERLNLNRLLKSEGSVVNSTDRKFLTNLLLKHDDYTDITQDAYVDNGLFRFTVYERLIDDSPQLFVVCMLSNNHVPLGGFKMYRS